MQRYGQLELATGMVTDPDGEWVKYDDVESRDYDRIKELAELAHKTVMDVMVKGQIDGKRGWEAEHPSDLIYKAKNHIDVGSNEVNHEARDSHYTHALTHIAMALFLRRP